MRITMRLCSFSSLLLLLGSLFLIATNTVDAVQPWPNPVQNCMVFQSTITKTILRNAAGYANANILRNQSINAALPLNSLTNTLLAAFTASFTTPGMLACQVWSAEVTADSLYAVSLASSILKIPLIATTSNSVEVADRTLHPYLLRPSPPDTIYVDAFFQFALNNGWTRVAVIGSSELAGLGVTRYALKQSFKYPQLSVSTFVVPSSSAGFDALADKMLRSIRASNIYVIYIHIYKNVVTRFAARLAGLGMVGAPYTIMGSSAACENVGTHPMRVGLVCFAPSIPGNHRPRTSSPLQWANFIYSISGATFPGSNFYWGEYESTLLLAQALMSLARSGDEFSGATLMRELLAVDMVGPYSGVRYKFDPDTGGIAESLTDIINLQPSVDGSFAFRRIGTFNSNTKTIFLSQRILWSSGRVEIPLDYVPILPDQLTVHLSSTWATYALPILLCFVTTITSQMAISYAVSQKRRPNSGMHHGALGPSRGWFHSFIAQLPCFARRGSTQHGWIAVAAVLWGAVSIGCTALLTLNKTEFDALDVRFAVGGVIGALVLCTLSVWIAFELMYSEVKARFLSKRDANARRDDRRGITSIIQEISSKRRDKSTNKNNKGSENANKSTVTSWWARASGGGGGATTGGVAPGAAGGVGGGGYFTDRSSAAAQQGGGGEGTIDGMDDLLIDVTAEDGTGKVKRTRAGKKRQWYPHRPRTMPGNPCLLVLQLLQQLFTVATLRMYAASVLLSLSTVGSMHVLIYAMRLPCYAYASIGDTIIAPLLLAPINLCLLVFAFYDARTRTQLAVSVLFSVATLIERIMDLAAYTFRFDQALSEDPVDTSTTLDDGAVTLFCAAFAGVTIFVLTWLVLNINSLSRSALELLLLDAQRAVKSVEEAFQVEQRGTAEVLEQLKMYHYQIEAITHVRPCLLNLSLAFTLGQDLTAYAEASDQVGLDDIGPTSARATLSANQAPCTQFTFSPLVKGRASRHSRVSGSSLSTAVGTTLLGSSPMQSPLQSLLVAQKPGTDVQRCLSTLRALSVQDAGASAGAGAGAGASSAVSEALQGQGVQLEDVLVYPVTLELFKDFLQSSLSPLRLGGVELVMLWLDAKRIRAVSDSNLRLLLTQRMMHFYFGADSPMRHLMVSSVPANVREAVLSASHRQMFVTPASLDMLMKTVLGKLRKDVVKAFQASPHYRVCCLMLLGDPTGGRGSLCTTMQQPPDIRSNSIMVASTVMSVTASTCTSPVMYNLQRSLGSEPKL